MYPIKEKKYWGLSRKENEMRKQRWDWEMSVGGIREV